MAIIFNLNQIYVTFKKFMSILHNLKLVEMVQFDKFINQWKPLNF